jgi:hypothetical protein
MHFRVVGIVGLLASLAWSSNSALALPPDDLRTVVISSSTPLPGLPSGAMIEQFAFPRIDLDGRVAFKARLIQGTGGVNSNNKEAIWAETDIDDLQLVARSGEIIAGTGFRFEDVEPGENLRMSGNGTVYFISGMGDISSPTVRNSAVFRFSTQAGLEIAVSAAPTGLPGIPFTNSGTTSNFLDFNELGDLTVTGTGGTAYLLPFLGNVALLPGSGPMINDRREVASLSGGATVRRLQVRNSSGDLRTLATVGTAAPDTNGATFRTGGLGVYDNADGATVFVGRVTGSGTTDANDFGLWTERDAGSPVELLIREGDQAPGLEMGVVWSNFTQFSDHVSFGRSGGIAVRVGLSGPGVTESNDWGVWAGTVADGLHLVARAGDPAPGTEPGVVFSDFTQAGVTPDGRGVFYAFLSRLADPAHDRGIWAEGTDGLLHLIARQGTTTVLPTGDSVTLTSVQFNPYFGVSESGAIAFLSNFEGGSGIFVSNTVAIPEPSTVTILTFAVAIGWPQRKYPPACMRPHEGLRQI